MISTRVIVDDRPLTWRSLSRPSKLMVPWYFILASAAAIVYGFDPQGRLALVPGVTAARDIAHGRMWLWGLVFGGLAAIMACAFANRTRRWLGLGLYLGSVIFLVWTVFTVGSVVQNRAASLMAPAWVFGNALACAASARSILTREVPAEDVLW